VQKRVGWLCAFPGPLLLAAVPTSGFSCLKSPKTLLPVLCRGQWEMLNSGVLRGRFGVVVQSSPPPTNSSSLVGLLSVPGLGGSPSQRAGVKGEG